MSVVISARNLTKRFGDFTAVDNVSFDVDRGTIFGFLGPNGSGKTTTIRMMLGLLEPTDGVVEILGISGRQATRDLRTRVGYMSQRFSLYNDLTVLQNLQFYGAAYGLEKTMLKSKIDETIAAAGLAGKENIKTAELSGGWRQRLALGVAIIHRPEIVFLDEPTAGVDPVSRRAFWNLLYILVKDGITVFVTTHYMDEAEHCHQLAFIQGGQILVSGTPAEIKADVFEGGVVEVFVDDQPQAVSLLRASFTEPGDLVELYGSSIHIVSKRPRVESRILSLLSRQGVRIHHIQRIPPSLEDVFIYSVGKKKMIPDLK